jgi:hypothetical protein
MIVPYYPEESKDVYQNYYANQVGHGIGVFSGSTIQRGGGIGSFLSSVSKSVLPLLKSGVKSTLPLLKSAGKELINTGASIASDVLRGQNVRQSAGDRFKNVGKNIGSNLLNNLVSNINSPPNGGYNSGGEDDRLALPPRPSKRRRRQNTTKRSKRAKSDTLFRNVQLKT